MLHQESRFERQVHDLVQAKPEKMSMIAYRSLAAFPPTDTDLQQLLRVAQSRNRAAGLTGVLVHDGGAYFQWLEGPTDSLRRVWASILRDRRHRQITVLREESVCDRVFQGCDLRIAVGSSACIEAAVAALEAPSPQLRRLIGRPKSIADLALEDAFATIVIPSLLAVHGRGAPAAVRFKSTASIWHADEDSGSKLAGVLISPRAAESSIFVDALLEQGASFNALCKEVFEPTQLHLGKLWDQDLCDDFHLTIGLARLQMEMRRVNAAMPTEHRRERLHSVLLSAGSDEPHCAGMIMASQVYERSGWEVMCNFPGDDQALNELLQTQWFDVLQLSQSRSLRRDSRLMSVRATIDSARVASLNPSLIVMVDGRTFAERPGVYRTVHANAMCVSALDSAPTAERLVEASRSVIPVSVASVS